jgi:hypothetical protein
MKGRKYFRGLITSINLNSFLTLLTFHFTTPSELAMAFPPSPDLMGVVATTTAQNVT